MFKETRNVIGETTPAVLAPLFWGVVVFGVVVGVSYGAYSVLKPAETAIDNKTFHNSQSYNDSMARDLDNYRMSYNSPEATESSKNIIRATIKHQYAGYDASNLPADLRAFLNQMKGY